MSGNQNEIFFPLTLWRSNASNFNMIVLNASLSSTSALLARRVSYFQTSNSLSKFSFSRSCSCASRWEASSREFSSFCRFLREPPWMKSKKPGVNCFNALSARSVRGLLKRGGVGSGDVAIIFQSTGSRMLVCWLTSWYICSSQSATSAAAWDSRRSLWAILFRRSASRSAALTIAFTERRVPFQPIVVLPKTNLDVIIEVYGFRNYQKYVLSSPLWSGRKI